MARRIAADGGLTPVAGRPEIGLSELSAAVIQRYLEDAIAAEKSFESQFRSFAEEGDDDEVQSLFAQHSRQTAEQIARLLARLEALGGSPSRLKDLLAHALALAPKAVQLGHLPDERLVQNLIAGFSIEMNECAMCQSLLTVANLAGDTITSSIASDIIAESREAAATFWSFIPTRAKIAFNMATAGEVDPAVETKAPDDRLL